MIRMFELNTPCLSESNRRLWKYSSPHLRRYVRRGCWRNCNYWGTTILPLALDYRCKRTTLQRKETQPCSRVKKESKRNRAHPRARQPDSLSQKIVRALAVLQNI